MIEVGEYVRTKNGIIDRIKTINRYGTVTKYDDKEDKISIAINYYINSGLEVNKDDIVKHSKNIIDLIELGDYVNGNEVLDKYLFNGEKPVLETTGDETNAKCVCEGDIRTILTKELYKANCYTVEGKEKC